MSSCLGNPVKLESERDGTTLENPPCRWEFFHESIVELVTNNLTEFGDFLVAHRELAQE